jgi:hypothetical protein
LGVRLFGRIIKAMIHATRFPEAYRSFLDFVGNDVQRERHRSNRRMLSVFFWCFLLPAVFAAFFLVMIKMGFLPRKARASLDWLILVFPVLYSLYILSSEFLTGIPSIFRRGGLAVSLNGAAKEGEWRDRVCDSLRTSFQFSEAEWSWIVESFRIDLDNIRHRTKYLTALAGAVFFLIMQGLDSLTDTAESTTWVKNPVFGWMETSTNVSQFMALALFLVLLYLSGNQTYHALLRYLNSAELVLLQRRAQIKE